MKKTIAFLILISMLVLSSCDIYYRYSIKNGPHPKDTTYFPEGYTGGFGFEKGDFNSAYYWVETYDECIEAIEQLKSHGSTFVTSAIFSYEGELFDTKYCFSIGREQSDKINYGENPFDRWAEYVIITPYVFYDDVTIDELIYSYTSEYKCAYFHATTYFRDMYAKDPSINSGDFICQWDGEKYVISNSRSEKPLFMVRVNSEQSIPESHMESIIDSIIIVE